MDQNLSLEDKQLLSYIAAAIHYTSLTTGIPPRNLILSDLRKNLKDNALSQTLQSDKLRALGGFINIRDFLFPPTLESVTETDIAKVAIKKDAAIVRKELQRLVQTKTTLSEIETLFAKQYQGKIKASGYSVKKSRSAIKRELNLLISDTHFQLLQSRQGLIPYGAKEEARRLAQIVAQTIQYKQRYRQETSLRLHLMGDIIQGAIHDPRIGAEYYKQMVGAMELLLQAVACLAAEFPSVTVHCATGNHGRNTARHQTRAVWGKNDSHETVIYHSLRLASANLKNVTFDIPETPFVEFKSFGKSVFGTHGDTVFTTGQVNNSINVDSLDRKINRINAGRSKNEDYKLFFMGHIHVGSLIHLPNNVKVITNGALVPPDQFSESIGLFSNTCGQTLWESTEKYLVGDYRFIEVDENTDRDSKLDSFIKEYKG